MKYLSMPLAVADYVVADCAVFADAILTGGCRPLTRSVAPPFHAKPVGFTWWGAGWHDVADYGRTWGLSRVVMQWRRGPVPCPARNTARRSPIAPRPLLFVADYGRTWGLSTVVMQWRRGPVPCPARNTAVRSPAPSLLLSMRNLWVSHGGARGGTSSRTTGGHGACPAS
jgi:hypothetical protein